MTTLSLILNRNVALMSGDTKVTVKGIKSVKGEHKLFYLSNSPSMGMMVFGKALFGEILISSLIKKFANQNDFNELATVNNVRKEFLSFLAKNTPENDLKDFIKERVDKFKFNLKFRLESFKKDEFKIFIDSQEKGEILSFLKRFDIRFDDILGKYVGGDELNYYNSRLLEIFSRKLSRDSTSIIIVGFDKNKNKPSFCHFDIYLNDNGKIISELVISENEFDGVAVIPFGEKSEINTYMNGINKEMEEYIINSIKILIKTSYDELIKYLKQKNYDPNQMKEIENDINNFSLMDIIYFDDFQKNFEALKSDNRNIVLDVVKNFPTNKLVEFAQFFIKITSYRLKFSFNKEYVGDDVDVAVLKPNEFIWAEYSEIL